jgi:hypothetical protein
VADPAETHAAFAELLTEMALQHLHPAPLPPQPEAPADVEQALARLAEAMQGLYAARRR